MRIYAIGDIHGRLDLLNRALSGIDADLHACPATRAIEVFVGDYVDRGPASREVLDRLIERANGHEMVALKGNHERLLLDFLDEPEVLESWQHLGGLETLLSYGLTPSIRNDREGQAKLAEKLNDVFPDAHRQFMKNLRLSFTCGDFFFAHAGVRPGIALPSQQEDDLLWIRDPFLSCKEGFGKVVVHGHTPVLEPEVECNRINIDTGAYVTGRLTCVVIEQDKLMLLEA
jgi:serine/threonine protein phosphatase 1